MTKLSDAAVKALYVATEKGAFYAHVDKGSIKSVMVMPRVMDGKGTAWPLNHPDAVICPKSTFRSLVDRGCIKYSHIYDYVPLHRNGTPRVLQVYTVVHWRGR